ncbi:hypothetical protein L861_13635 [Litchfieldella anticariensis FP35 = DSM 16096]|uniref:LysM domain-containing protein n=1 Tax=Litchfieldella anticariensis (strain DSM 16096 / CECT 5854 / CIP 108499 / LMG 22089 / FP35) TaxID=1121939 RepID=S2KFC5_LITA3|nr:hypothetical protein [Halomonas anticariensis]EPC00827.1 hypothetical protein L861_13635 [Halomonas anticariensis FP35 = DSM 16096]
MAKLQGVLHSYSKTSSSSGMAFAKAIVKAQKSPSPQPVSHHSPTQWSHGTSPIYQAQTGNLPTSSGQGFGVYSLEYMEAMHSSALNQENDLSLTPDDYYFTPAVDTEEPYPEFEPVDNVSEADPPDADELVADVSEGKSLDLVAEENELSDRDETIAELEAGGYDVSVTEEDGVRITEITHPETDETITETVRPNGDEGEVVTIQTTGGENDHPTVVIDEEGHRTELDPSQETTRESVDEIAESFAEGQELGTIADELGITEEQLTAQLLAAGFKVADWEQYDQEGNYDGRYRAIYSYGDDREIIASYDDRKSTISNYDPRGRENGGNGHYSYFIDSQGRVVERYSTRPEGPLVDGGLDIEIIVDEEGVTTRTITDNGETRREVSRNDRTVITDDDGNVTLRDDESGDEIAIEDGEVSGDVNDDIDEAMLETIQATDLDGEHGEIFQILIDAWLNRDSWLFGGDEDSRADELREDYNSHKREMEDAVEEYGENSDEAQEALRARDIAYAAWQEAAYASLVRRAALEFYAVDPDSEEAMRSSMARINEILNPHGMEWSQPDSQLSPEEASERLEEAERGLELAREAKEELQEAERLLDETNSALEEGRRGLSPGEIAGDNSAELAQAAVMFSNFEVHRAKGDDRLSDFDILHLERLLEEIENNPSAYEGIDAKEVDEYLDQAKRRKENTEEQLARAESQHDVDIARLEAAEIREQIADEYIEEYVDENGTVYRYDGIFGQHSGEYKGYSFNDARSAADGGVWIDIHYENTTKTVNVAPADDALDTRWENNRNADLIRQWHEAIGRLDETSRAAGRVGVEHSAARIEELGGDIGGLEGDLEEQERAVGPPSVAAPEGAPPEHELVEIGGTVQVPRPVAERYAQIGVGALEEFDLPARVLVDDSDNPFSHPEWRWVERSELASVYLELQETKDRLTVAEQSAQWDAQQAVWRARLPGESEEEYSQRAMYDSLGGDYQQRILDDFYQSRFEEFFADPTFNAEYERREEGELGGWTRQALGVSGGRIGNLDKVLEQIRDHGGDNPEVRAVPLSYVGLDGNEATIALVAVKRGDGDVRYVDATGRDFRDLEDFSKHNRQFNANGRLVAPTDLEMTPDRDENIPLEVVDVRAPDMTLDNAVNYTTMAATGASFIPGAAPVALPLAVAGGIYIGARSAYNQWHHVGHGGDWYDTESLMNYGAIASAALPMAAGPFRYVGMVNAARGLDVASLAVDIPQTLHFSGHVYRNHHQMSDREFTDAMMNLAIGVFGTGMSIRGLQSSGPGEGGTEGTTQASDGSYASRHDGLNDTPVVLPVSRRPRAEPYPAPSTLVSFSPFQQQPSELALSAAYHPEGTPYPERPSTLPEGFRRPNSQQELLPDIASDSPLSLTGTAHPKPSVAPVEVFTKRKVDTSIHEYRPEVLRTRMPWAAEEAYTPTPDHEEPTVIFRGDGRPPGVIFANGFREEGQPDPYGAISTSVSARDAKSFAIVDPDEGNTKSGWLYTIVDSVSDEAIVSSLPVEDKFLIGMDHYEIRFNGQIPSENILAARQVDADGHLFGAPIYNPNFKNPSWISSSSSTEGNTMTRVMGFLKRHYKESRKAIDRGDDRGALGPFGRDESSRSESSNILKRQPGDSRLPSHINYTFNPNDLRIKAPLDSNGDIETVRVYSLRARSSKDSSIEFYAHIHNLSGEIGSGPVIADLDIGTFYRGSLPKGSGSILLADLLRTFEIRPRRLVGQDVRNENTLNSYWTGGDPAQTVLGRSRTRALQELGLEPASHRFELVQDGGEEVVQLITEVALPFDTEGQTRQSNQAIPLAIILNDIGPSASQDAARITVEVIDSEHLRAFDQQLTPHELLISPDLHRARRQWRDAKGPLVLDIQNPSDIAHSLAQKIADIYRSEIVIPNTDIPSQWRILHPGRKDDTYRSGSVKLVNGELILTQERVSRVIQPAGEHLGEMLGAGLHKTAFAFCDKVLVIFRNETSLYSADAEKTANQTAIDQGFPFVAPIHGIVNVYGHNALLMDRYPGHSGTLLPPGANRSLLSQNSIRSLQATRDWIIAQGKIPSDLQFLIGEDGTFYLHDFSEIRTFNKPIELWETEQFIELAREVVHEQGIDPGSLSASYHPEGSSFSERPSPIPEAFRRPERQPLLPDLTSDSPLSLTGTAHFGNSDVIPHKFRLETTPPEGFARLYRLDDLETLNRASSNGALPSGHYVHVIRSVDPARDGTTFTLNRGTVPRSGRVDADGHLRWPSSGRGERVSLSVAQAESDRQIVHFRDQNGNELARDVNANGDVYVIVTDLSQTNLRHRLRGDEGLPYAEHSGNGLWATSPLTISQKSQPENQPAIANDASPNAPQPTQESRKPAAPSVTEDTTPSIDQLSSLSETQLNSISPSELAQIATQQFRQLRSDQLAAFTELQWNALRKPQLDQIDTSLLQQHATRKALKEADRKGTITKLSVGAEGPIFQLHGVDRRGFDELRRQSSWDLLFFRTKRTTEITENPDGAASTAKFRIDSGRLRDLGFLDPQAESLLPKQSEIIEIQVHRKSHPAPDVSRNSKEMTKTALAIAIASASGSALMLPELIPIIPQAISQVANTMAYGLRGASFIIRSRFPAQTAPDTNLGRNLRLLEIATTVVHFTGTGQKILEGQSPVANVMIEMAYALYSSITFMEAVTGKAFTGKKIQDIWRGLTGREYKMKPDDLGLQLYFWGSATPLVVDGLVLSGTGGWLAGAAATSGLVGGVLFSLGSLVLYRNTYMASLVARHISKIMPDKFVFLNSGSGVKEMTRSDFVNVVKPPWWRFPSTADRDFALFIGGGLLSFSLWSAMSLISDFRDQSNSGSDETEDEESESRSGGLEPQRAALAPDGLNLHVNSSNEGVVVQDRRTDPALESQGYLWVEVLPGQSLGSIAVAHGYDVVDVAMLNMDHLGDLTSLKAGDRVYLPGSAQTSPLHDERVTA